MSMATRSSNLDDQKTGVNIYTKGHTPYHQAAAMALKRLRHLAAPHPIHHPSLWQENQHLTAMRLGIVWKYK